MELIIYIFGLTVACGFIFASFVSIHENEPRAAIIAFISGIFILLIFLIPKLIQSEISDLIGYAFLIISLIFIVSIFIPLGKRHYTDNNIPQKRIDERDIMFARKELKEGTERFNVYYDNNPEKRPLDDKFRSRPGLLDKKSKFYNVKTFTASDVTFDTIAHLRELIEDVPAGEKADFENENITGFLKNWILKLGAVSVGVTKLHDYHLYSHRGRNEPYGSKIKKEHKFALALTVEMDKTTIDYAPFGPVIMESSEQYLKSGIIAILVAKYIRSFGYTARAHIDGNYHVVCPLVARDAGLGEIGRIGLLMTPKLGPRVRIAVITTDIPLTLDKPTRDLTVIDFCTKCKKCAYVCPNKAIPFDDRKEIDGIRRWQINQEACYTYWCTIGTDCTRCLSVCPYSHLDNSMHNFVRFGIRNSLIFRQFAIWADDLFYGKKPPAKKIPEWLK